MLSCRKIRELINLYIDGEANSNQKELLLSHVENCEKCRIKFDEAKEFHNAMKSVCAVKTPDNLSKTIMLGLQTEEYEKPSPLAFPLLGWAIITAVIMIIIFSTTWNSTKNITSNPEVAISKPEIAHPSPKITLSKPAIAPSKPEFATSKPEIAQSKPEIHIVSPQEDSVVEQQNVDISVAITGNLNDIHVILDGQDVTDSTEISKDFLIYTSEVLKNGYHKVIIQASDVKGVSVAQRSWEFYVIGS